MKKALERYHLIAFVLVLTCMSNHLIAQDADIEKLRLRVIDDALTSKGFLPRVTRYVTPQFDRAQQYLDAMSNDGSWSSVYYEDTDNDWSPLQALDKILVMSYAYCHPGHSGYKNQKLLTGISLALDYWYSVNPTCVNWYKNDIAKQMYLGVIAILLQDHIDEDLVQKMIADQSTTPRMTGSNRTLISISVFYRGILEKSTARISAAVEGVMSQIAISDDEGIQMDYSFHQHGPYLYNGSYGSNFLRETLWLAALVQGTSFALSEARLETLRDYYVEGTRWMMRGRLIDYNVCGRQVGRPTSMNINAADVMRQLDCFVHADPAHAELYLDSKSRIQKNIPQKINGNKHYWRSDYSVHHRADYFTSLRMCSARTIGVETDVNYENLLGRNIPYGMTYIYRRGDEYEDVFPVWDWAKLPGVTCSYEVPVKKGNYTQATQFVGGVSDGMYGVSTMDLDLRSTSAKKSWFWFDREWVALGADIESSREQPIVTGVNQCNKLGDVVVDGELFVENSTITGPGLIWHDSVAYIFPNKPSHLKLSAARQSGSMRRIYGLGADSLISKDLFTVWYDHGVAPKKATYQYIVVPGISRQSSINYEEQLPIKVLANDDQVQAVKQELTGVTGIVFHQGISVLLDKDLSIQATEPCLILINPSKKEITVSDPTGSMSQVQIQLKWQGAVKESVMVKLPQGQAAGKSVTVDQDFEILFNSH